MLKLPCEIMARILPTLRALIAHKLVKIYGFSQAHVAALLGVTQATVSHYLSGKRGKLAGGICELEELELVASDIARRVAQESMSSEELRKELCRFCSRLKKRIGLT